MTAMRLVRLFAGLFVLLLGAGCASQPMPERTAPRESARVPMRLQGAHPIVEARVNGQTLRLIVDSGADQNVLSAQAVARLGLATSRQTVSGQGAAGAFGAVPWVDLGAVGIGDVRLRDQVAFVVPLPEETNADGILGLPLFARYTTTLDYAAGELRLEAPRAFQPPADLTALPLRQQGGKLLLRATVAGVEGWYALDTGAGNAATMFTPTVERERLRAAFPQRLRMMTGISAGGTTRGDLVRVPEVRLGPYRLERVVVELSLAEAGYFAHPPADAQGNLGGELWRRFTTTIDLPGGRVFLRPNGAFADPFAATRSGLVAYRQDGRLVVADVVAASPAASAGLSVGDAIVAVNGVQASAWTASAFRDLLSAAPGTSIGFGVVGKDGKERQVTLVLKDLL